MASLQAPIATLKRAHKDLANLKLTLETLREGKYRGSIVAKSDPANAGQIQYNLPNPLEDVSADIGVITGQLRAALDQLVHSLFELRNGHPPPAERRTQFPICKSPQDFRSRIKPDLEGLDDADIALIEKAQPYNGGHWLADLKLLAEEHKHRQLVYVTSGSRVQFHASVQEPGQTLLIGIVEDPTDTTGLFHTLPVSGVRVPKAMNVDTKIAGPVAFRDGIPVIEKLQVLEAEVAYVVDAFKPLFD
jgi:hypothetical protein